MALEEGASERSNLCIIKMASISLTAILFGNFSSFLEMY